MDLWPMTVGESEPLDCDEAAYAYIGHRILQGDVMYRDLTENKPPLGYWLYTLGVAVGGYRELAIRLMAIPVVLATIAVVWWIALRLGGPVAACLAAGLYILLSTDPSSSATGRTSSISSTSSRSYPWPPHRGLGPREPLVDLRGRGLPGFGGAGQTGCDRPCDGLRPGDLAAGVVSRIRPSATMGPRARRCPHPRPGCRIDRGVAAAIVLAGRARARPAFEDIILQGGALATDTLPEPNAPPWTIRWLTGNADPNGQLPWPFGDDELPGLVGERELAPLAGFGPGAELPDLRQTGRRAAAPRPPAGPCAAWLQVALPGLYWQHYYLLPIPGRGDRRRRP